MTAEPPPVIADMVRAVTAGISTRTKGVTAALRRAVKVMISSAMTTAAKIGRVPEGVTTGGIDLEAFLRSLVEVLI